MNISEAADQSGLPAKTIRYYEEIGLVTPAARRTNGYRDYAQQDIHTLRFLNRARNLGFSVEDCRALMTLYTDRTRKSSDVKALAQTRIENIDLKIAELRSMRRTLEQVAEKCHGDDRPNCPILDDLASEENA